MDEIKSEGTVASTDKTVNQDIVPDLEIPNKITNELGLDINNISDTVAGELAEVNDPEHPPKTEVVENIIEEIKSEEDSVPVSSKTERELFIERVKEKNKRKNRLRAKRARRMRKDQKMRAKGK